MKKNIFILIFSILSVIIVPRMTQPCMISQDCTACSTPCAQSKNTWLPHAFCANASREITEYKTVFQTESNREEWDGTVSFIAQYSQNFGAKCNSCKNLGSMPFWGASGTNTMTIGNNNGKADLDAFNFGLGDVAVGADGIGGSIAINPKITEVGTDFLLYFVHNKNERGLYFKVHAPLGAMIIDPQMQENGTKTVDSNFSQITTDGTAITYNTNYPAIVDRPTSLSSAFAGGIGGGNTLAGQSNEIWLGYGKIGACKQTQIRLADLSFVLGYNVLASEKGFLGLGFKTTCPTGNVPTAEYMLEPIFGRGGYWGIGADVMARYKIWENDASDKFLDFWMQGELLHLVPGRTGFRSFDLLANGKGSKYILIQWMKNNSNGTVSAQGLTQAINQTTLPVVSKFAIEGNLALMLDYHCYNWNFALSGEFWGRTKECLAIDKCRTIEVSKANLNRWAVVGRQASLFNILTTTGGTGGDNPLIDVVPLCEPNAKINKSASTIQLDGGASTTYPTFPTTYSDDLKDAKVAANRIPADLSEALDICGAAAARAFTGKVFAQLGYTWSQCRYTPNFSVIGEAEFTGKTNAATQMWSAGVQGSINF